MFNFGARTQDLQAKPVSLAASFGFKKRKGHRVLKRALVWIGFAIFVLGGFGSGLLALTALVVPASHASADGFLPLVAKAIAESTRFSWSGADRMNILVLGIDRRPDEDWDTRTDAIMVLTLDVRRKRAGALSIPRDMWVPIPLQNGRVIQDRINAANVYGALYKYPGGGPALTRATVQYNLGIPIDRYVMFDFEGFKGLIDSLGGIDVDVPVPLTDNEYPTEDYGIQRIFIPAGNQHFDGEHALRYARSRHQDWDFGRMQRQQLVLRSVRERLMQLGVLPRAPGLWAQFSDVVRTDLSLQELVVLGTVVRDIPPELVTTRVLDQEYATPFIGVDGADLLMPQRNRIRVLVQEIFGDSPAPQAGLLSSQGIAAP